jgi:GT2 family glycosyltransferase
LRRRFAAERLLGIRKPEVDLPRYEFDPNEARPGRPDVVVLPVIAWSDRRQRPQQLSEALARAGRRVFYGAVRGPGAPREAAGVAPGVTLVPIAGVAREDIGDRRLTGTALAEAIDSLARARRDYELHEAAVLVESPFWGPLAFELRARFGWKVVYDCLDVHAGFSTNRPEAIDAGERRLAGEADLLVATSLPLRERLGPRTRLLPNAGDYRLFEAAPEDKDRGDRPFTVGYVGAVDDWFDAPLFEKLARRRPDWRFEVIGGSDSGRAPFAGDLPNVVFHGERPHADLPRLRARFDAEIIPFRLTELTHAVDPVKLYEAAAAGRPVVATHLRSLEEHSRRGVLRFADDAAGFERALAESASEEPAAAEARRAFARENTWDDRARILSSWLEELYPLVSILVVTHDGLPHNRLCLESLDRRTDWPRTEILFADNASTDGTREWLESEGARRGKEFRLLTFGENRGFAPAVNAAAASARGDYLCFLNNDTVVTRGWLSALVRHLERDSSLGMVGPSTNEIANEARVEVGYRDPEELEPWARAYTRSNAGRADPIRSLAMFCVLLSRKVFEAVGPLDERFLVGMFEDDDYCRRLRDRGLSLAVARDSFVHHWGRGTFRRLPDREYQRVWEENRRRFEEKWGAPPPDRSPAEELAALAREAGGVVIFPPSIGWEVTLVQRPHHLARAFSRLGIPVVFEVDAESGAAPAGSALARIEPRLFLRTGGDPLPDIPGRVVWAFAYNVPAEAALRGARLVYDVIDALEVFPYPRGRLERSHARALERAEVVFAVSRPLFEEVRRSRPDAILLPNGVDASRFAADPDPESAPEPIRRARAAGRPVAGYVGALARWVDGDLLVDLARLRPDWDFFLVGEELDRSLTDRLERAPGNLRFLGPRPYAAMPAVLASFDVGLIPFSRGREGQHASPIKLYEYLAAGIPVLSTPSPETESVPEVETADGAADMASRLDPARARRASPEFRERARARARENDWSRRARVALQSLRLVRVPDAPIPSR